MPYTYHIVVADDNEMLHHILETLILRVVPNVRITLSRNGAAALVAHANEPTDLIITDYNMPDITGIDLIRGLRAQHDSTPIVLCSADTTIAAAGLASGANLFVSKTRLLSDLPRAIQALLPLYSHASLERETGDR